MTAWEVVQRLARRRVAFVLVLATLLVLLRFAAFDARYLVLHHLPNHDMFQAAGLFSSHMHAMRTGGDLAWWNPVSENGFEQYPISMLSPLPPTQGHIVFILSAGLVGVLGLLSLAVPEYLLYLLVTYGLLPWLSLAALGLLLTRLLRHPLAVGLVLVSYALTAPGLAHSMYVYWQEPFSMFLLLWAYVALLQDPRPHRLAWLGIAGLIQAASLNYWTVFNSWFMLLFVVGYALFHPGEVRATLGFMAGHLRRAPLLWAGGLLLIGATLGAWGVIIADSAAATEDYVRGTTNEPVYSAERAWDLVNNRPPGGVDTQFLIPLVEWAAMLDDNADGVPQFGRTLLYLGAWWVPGLVLFLAMRWRARDWWLLGLGAALLFIASAPRVLFPLYESFPGVNRIQHFFYFYAYHWQFALLLMAARGLDTLLTTPDRLRPWAGRALLALLGLAACLLLALPAYRVIDWDFSSAGFQALSLMALLIGGVTGLVYALWGGFGMRRALLVLLASVALWDGVRYFSDASYHDWLFSADYEFFPGYTHPPAPLDDATRARLMRPWDAPNPGAHFTGGLADNLPIKTATWPENDYLLRDFRAEADDLLTDYQAEAFRGPALAFYPAADTLSVTSLDAMRALFADPAQRERLSWSLMLHETAPDIPGEAGAPEAFAFTWETWGYNGHRVRLQAPGAGWVLLRQTYDPDWQLRLNGAPVTPRRANIMGMAFPVTEGAHTLTLAYHPTARTWYWPAALLLLASLLVLGGYAWRMSSPPEANV